MAMFLKIITFPIRLIILIAALIIRGILHIVGSIICLMFATVCGILSIIGHIVNLGVLAATILIIIDIREGSQSLGEGIKLIALFWVIALMLDSVCFIGDEVGEFLKEIGEKINDWALDLLMI